MQYKEGFEMEEAGGLPLWEKITHPFVKALDRAFGCRHTNLSRVFTVAGRSYRICCDCATDFDYSLETMSIAAPSDSQSPLHHLRTRHI